MSYGHMGIISKVWLHVFCPSYLSQFTQRIYCSGAVRNAENHWLVNHLEMQVRDVLYSFHFISRFGTISVNPVI